MGVPLIHRESDRDFEELEDLVDQIKENSVLSNSTEKSSAKKTSLQPRVAAAIGSERGWTDKERSLLSERGFTLCSMGNRVMRTETAATVAASVILAERGLLC